MLKIGLTGGIGSGKTVVAQIFSVLGAPVFNADVEAKLIMEKDKHLILSIKNAFGDESYIGEKINRKYLAEIVFSDAVKLKQLNALVHPAAIDAANTWMSKQEAPYLVKEAALLFESGSASNLDLVVGVYASPELRIKRAMERDKATFEQVFARMQKQMNEDEKMEKCDFVVINDEQQLLIPEVLQLHEKFLQGDL